MKWWMKVAIMVIGILWVTIAEVYFSATHGPTITWLFSHYVPQSVTFAIIGALISWLPKHFKDAYNHMLARRLMAKIEDDNSW